MRLFFLQLLSMCLLAASTGAAELVEIQTLLPTQSSVGMKAVEVKKKEISEKSAQELQEFLKNEPVPVVIGPGGKKYLIDHHHQSRALLDLGKTECYVTVETDWSELSPQQFWKRMEQNNYVYLRDASGQVIESNQLPTSIATMSDDPYRSLAYFARKAKAYKKSKVPFSEFKWAEYYRENIPLKDLQRDWEAALKKAVEISALPAAKALPGYKSTDGSR